MSVQYPIRAVAKLTGLTVDTLRAWERRYGAVTPGRSARGRVYGDSDVRRLRLLRIALENGHAIGQVALMSDSELQELTTFPPRQVQTPETHPPVAVPLELRTLAGAIGAFDEEAVTLELSRMALLLSPVDLVFKVVLPLMQMVGANWEGGAFEVAHEHMLSASVRNLLGGLIRMRSGDRPVRLLFTTPHGEQHEFGILSGAMLAAAHRFQVSYFGPNMPAREILFAARRCAPHVVVLGVMETNATPAVRAEIDKLSTDLPPDTGLWVGGTGASMVVDNTGRAGTFIMQDLSDFERHLTGWDAAHPPTVR